MAKQLSVPRGTADILPAEIPFWQDIEQNARELANNYGYKEIRTPVFEDSSLFKRSLGQTSEVVNKQLLELTGDSKEGFALRPEGTASIVRSYIENSFDRKENISKLFYIGPMFRGERPQKGRLRQFHQIGVEAIGPAAISPYLDAEIIILSVKMLESFGVKNFTLKINTLGTLKDKDNFAKLLRAQLKPYLGELAQADQDRFDRNVFRVLDSKSEQTQKVISKLNLNYDHLSKESRDYFETVKKVLTDSKIEFEETPNLVRGLDYYTHTVFELSCSDLGAQDAVGAGGRYSDLVSQLGGPKVDAIGFALGMERILIAAGRDQQETLGSLDVFAIALDESLLTEAFSAVMQLRKKNFSADMNFQVSSIKSQMRQANKSGARFVLILGEDELKSRQVTVKNMETGNQSLISLDNLEQFQNS